MTWTVDPKKSEATNEHGYVMRWADNKHGTYFNAYSPKDAHVSAGYDKEKVKADCEIHRKKLETQRTMAAAMRAAKEVA